MGPFVPSQVILLLAGPMKMKSWKNKKTKHSRFCWQGQWILNGCGLIFSWIWSTQESQCFCIVFYSIWQSWGPFPKNCTFCVLAPSKNNERAAHPLGKPIKHNCFLKIFVEWLFIFIGLLSETAREFKDFHRFFHLFIFWALVYLCGIFILSFVF